MVEAAILTNDVTRQGLRRLELMQMGAAVDGEMWAGALPPFADETLKLHRTYEAGLDVHHLWLTWRPREVVHNILPGLTAGVCWWIGEGQRISEALEAAAAWHQVMLGAWPTHAWLEKMPSGMEAGVSVVLEMGSREGAIDVILSEGAVPRRCVVVGLTPAPTVLPLPQAEGTEMEVEGE